MFFWKKAEKWHEVRWFNGPRDIYLAIQFAGDDDGDAAGGDVGTAVRPAVQRLASKDAGANDAQPPIDESLLVGQIESAVREYNKRNLCGLRVAAVKYRAKGGADVADHGSAARKLLNLL